MSHSLPEHACDLAILGGGLAGGLIALALAKYHPHLRVIVLERGENLGGHHVWSFFASDLEKAERDLLEPLITARWQGYSVRFPKRTRHLSSLYCSANSARLDAAIRAALPEECIWTNADVVSIKAADSLANVHTSPAHQAPTPDAATIHLADGRALAAAAVIDARGVQAMPHMQGGWQKFTGHTLRTKKPHGLSHPIVMDATVAQIDGYRFVYCLPFSATEIFVEDTYYSDSAELDLPAMRVRIAAYAAQQGWDVAEVVYEESGVLPVIAAGDFDAFWQASKTREESDSAASSTYPTASLAQVGTRAALCHPLTSYSLPDAARMALKIALLDNPHTKPLSRLTYDWAAHHWREGRFYRMLSRMLFGAAKGADRWHMLARFYTLSEPLIERFYAGRSTTRDTLRILAGKPPVPIPAAIASLIWRGHPLANLGQSLTSASPLALSPAKGNRP